MAYEIVNNRREETVTKQEFDERHARFGPITIAAEDDLKGVDNVHPHVWEAMVEDAIVFVFNAHNRSTAEHMIRTALGEDVRIPSLQQRQGEFVVPVLTNILLNATT